MDHWNIPLTAGFGDVFHRLGVYGKAFFFSRFAAVHVGVGGGVNDQLRRDVGYGFAAFGGACDVNFLLVHADDFVTVFKLRREITSQHPFMSQQ